MAPGSGVLRARLRRGPGQGGVGRRPLMTAGFRLSAWSRGFPRRCSAVRRRYGRGPAEDDGPCSVWTGCRSRPGLPGPARGRGDRPRPVLGLGPGGWPRPGSRCALIRGWPTLSAAAAAGDAPSPTPVLTAAVGRQPRQHRRAGWRGRRPGRWRDTGDGGPGNGDYDMAWRARLVTGRVLVLVQGGWLRTGWQPSAASDGDHGGRPQPAQGLMSATYLQLAVCGLVRVRPVGELRASAGPG